MPKRKAASSRGATSHPTTKARCLITRKEKWLGKPICKRKDGVYYAKVGIKGEVFRIGDTVEIRIVSENKRKANEDSYSYGSIESFFQDSLGLKWAEVRWFFAPEETKLGRTRQELFSEYELFDSDKLGEVDLEAVNCKVKVVTEAKHKTLKDPSAAFFCKRIYYTELSVLGEVDWNQQRSFRTSRRLKGQSSDEQGNQPNGEESPFDEAIRLLQLSAIPQSMPCREKERRKIETFITNSLKKGDGALYISGMPGTGKTATVVEVVKRLQKAVNENKFAPFNVVEINGMKLQHPAEAYTIMWKTMTGESLTAAKAVQKLENHFSKAVPSAKAKLSLVIVDEIDYMVTQKQKVLYNLFDWPTRKHAKLVVLAIANTMDLPERFLPRVNSRLGMGRVTFMPYRREQIQKIICTRLNRLKVFDQDAIQLCSRKVAAVSGDVRRALQMCRRAAELCKDEGKTLVSIGHINKAARLICESVQIKRIGCASPNEQILLIAIYKHHMVEGVEVVPFERAWHRFETLFQTIRFGQEKPSQDRVLNLLNKLGRSRLLQLEHRSGKRFPVIRLGVEADDIKYVLAKKEEYEHLFS